VGDIFDIDTNQQAVDLLSPDKRGPITVALLRALLWSTQWCRDLVLGSYKRGSTAPIYAGGTYNKYDQVIFNKSVYYSLVANNAALPTDTTSWLKIQDNFIGVDERVRYNGQKIVLEYALNHRFGGTFRPPGSSSLSDIYINNVAPVPAGFRIGMTIGSTIGQTRSSDYIGLNSSYVQISNFNINFLNSLYILTNEQSVRDFVNPVIPASLNYTITPY
jgi:hypothetical protein